MGRSLVGLRRCAFPWLLRRALPEPTGRVLRRLEEAGYQAYIVGGAVRDLLLGSRPPDWDVATDALPQQVQALFPRCLPTGLRHGTCTVVQDGQPVQVTTLRREGAYGDRRRPDWVEFTGDLAADLARRDLTVNAMAADRRGRLYDPFGGVADLRRGRLRAVGDARRRMAEDALRLMRVVRFAAQMDMSLDPSLQAALSEQARNLREIARERVSEELFKALAAPHPERAVELLRRTGLLGPALGVEVDAPVAGWFTWEELKRILPRLPAQGPLRLAALLLAVVPTRIESALGNLRGAGGGRRFSQSVAALARAYAAIAAADAVPTPGDLTWRRWAARLGRPGLRLLAQLGAAAGRPAWAELLTHWASPRTVLDLADLAVGGGDLVQELGVAPGPQVRQILERLWEEVVAGRLPNRRAHLLAAARDWHGATPANRV